MADIQEGESAHVLSDQEVNMVDDGINAYDDEPQRQVEVSIPKASYKAEKEAA